MYSFVLRGRKKVGGREEAPSNVGVAVPVVAASTAKSISFLERLACLPLARPSLAASQDSSRSTLQLAALSTPQANLRHCRASSTAVLLSPRLSAELPRR